MKLIFADAGWEDYLYWQQADPKILDRLNALIKECQRDPFRGKPELLKGSLQGWWSRRLTREDRLVYRVAGAGDARSLEIAQCRLHY